MRFRSLLTALVLGLGCTLNAQFTDDFADGDFTAGPAWDGDASLFTVVDDAGNMRLRSNSAGAATYALTTASTIATEAQWEFFVNLRFATSGSNYADVFVMSTSSDITTAANGYFVRIGGTADRVELFRSQAGVNSSLIVSTDGIVNSSTNNPFTIRVRRIGTDQWSLEYDDGATGTYVSAGTATDATFGTSTHFGIRIVQSTAASVVNNHFFDDFTVGPIPVDNTPPSLVSATATSSTAVDVRFSEAVEQSSAENIGNYALLPSTAITTATRDGGDPALVHLVLGSALANGTSYTLTANGVEDLTGNASSGTSVDFSYTETEAAEPGDVVINELMADPSPVVQLPDAEFIELFNTTTDKFIDLTGWILSTSSTQANLPSITLAPGQYVVLVNNAQLPNFTGLPNVFGWTLSNTALLNAGTILTLTAPGSLVIDEVAYAIGWYGDPVKDDGGWSLERINPFAPCSDATNWIASNDERGGSPGIQNSVFNDTPDTQAPVLVAVQVTSATEIVLLFDERLDATSVPAATYTIAPVLSITNVQLDPGSNDRVRVTLSTPLLEGNTHTILVEGIADCSGNVATSNGPLPFSLIIPSTPALGDVVINEIMPDPSPVVQLPDAEYVELFNTTADKYFDLTGWAFATLSTQANLPSVLLGPGDHLLLVNTAQLSNFSGVPNALGWSLSNTALLNTGTTLTLTAPGELVIDVVAYSSTWYGDDVKDDGGWSLERKNPFAPCSDGGNWTASNDERGGTPGAQNSVYNDTPDTTPPTLNSVQVASASEVILVFNEGVDAASAVAATYTITPTLNVLVAVPTNDRVRLLLSGELVAGTFYTVTVEGVADCSGNELALGTGSFALPEPISANDIIINEVLYDPIGTGSDFVELYNRSAKVLSLGGLQLANESNGVIGNYRLITADPVILMPGEYILLATNSLDIATRYPQSRTERFLQMSLPSYNNGSGTVVVADAENNTIDLFRYDDNLHFTLLNTTEGTSLERVDPNRPTSDDTNWHSAAQDIGKATPGFENSQYAPAPEARGEMTIDPAIFSPDNDGHQDLLTIAYRFDQPGFVGTMIVYDIAGRAVRTLWNNELLGTSGAVSWDGIMDSGSKARMGPYIVLLEAYDLSGNVEKFRQTVTLAHRLD